MAKSTESNVVRAALASLEARIPPHNLEAEQSILGAILIDPDAILRVSDTLQAEDFYREDHRIVYQHMIGLFEKRKPIDMLTLTDALESSKQLSFVGGAAYIASLTGMVNSAVHIAHHAEIVRNKAMLRKLITAGSRIAELGYKEDAESDTVLDQAESTLFGVSQTYLSNNFVPIGTILSESFDRIDELHKNKGALRGVPSGFRDLDELLGGLQKSDLIILAARPSMGKCVTGDTEIINPSTGAMIPIRDMVAQEKGELVTLTSNWQLQPTQPSHFVADGVKPTFKVRTVLGHEIEATLPHPFLTIEGWKKLAELNIGDRIALTKEIPIFGQTQWPEHKVKALAYFIADGSLSRSCPTFTNDNPKIVADFEASVKAFGLVSVRCNTSHGTRTASYSVSVDSQIYAQERSTWSVAFGAFRSAYRQEVRQAVLATGLSASNINHWQNGVAQPSRATWNNLQTAFPECPAPAQYCNENPVTEFLQEQGVWGKVAHNKAVPEAVFTLTRPLLALFLNRLFSCDGTAYVASSGGKDFPVIAYCSVSKKLVQQVQHLLLRFGIIAKFRERRVRYKDSHKTAYELEIHGREPLLQFAKEIGIYGKESTVQKVVQSVTSHKAGWTQDTLPIEIWHKIAALKGTKTWRSIYDSLGLPATHNIHAFRRAPRRETVKKLATALGSEELAQLAEAPVYWDRIVEIVSTGVKEVFDLTVPETHNFVANNFIVHNTAFALNIAEHASIKGGAKVAIFSLEQSKDQLVDRLLCSQAGVDSWKLRSGNLSDEDFPRIGQAMGVLSEAPIFIDDTPGQTVLEVRTKARRLQMESGLDMIVIDYLQLMSGRGQENRVQEVSEISRALKGVARELNVPVIALSQLSRAVEARPDKRPLLSDLRESGSLEQDADVVMFIYREEYYERDSDKKNIAEILVRKHRNGPVGDVQLFFQGAQTRFRNLDKRAIKQKNAYD